MGVIVFTDTQTISFLSLCEWYKEKYLDAYIENGFGGSNAYNQVISVTLVLQASMIQLPFASIL
eukprot:m.114734 g.114734  ORF g.114734 m.114734 type:complete len:64 (-) comp14177_c1_seq4:1940-2131(-)